MLEITKEFKIQGKVRAIWGLDVLRPVGILSLYE
jgi:hypothetical protein